MKNRFVSRAIVGMVVVGLLPVLVVAALKKTETNLKAAGEQAQLSFLPSSSNLPPDRVVEVVLSSGSENIGFVSLVILFDINKVRLNGEVSTSNVFKTIIQKTSMTSANSTGRITLALGLSTEDKVNPPKGDMVIAYLPIQMVSQMANDNTNLNFDLGEVQVVAMDSRNLSVSTRPAILLLNSVSVTNSNNSSSGTSQPTVARCDSSVPAVPYISSLTRSGNSVTLNWNKVDLADHYSIVYGTRSGAYQYGVINTGNVNSFKISALNENNIYYFAIRAINNCMPSGLSKEMVALVKNKPKTTVFPSVPTPSKEPVITQTVVSPTVVLEPTGVVPIVQSRNIEGDLNNDKCVNFSDAVFWLKSGLKGGLSQLKLISDNWKQGCNLISDK